MLRFSAVLLVSALTFACDSNQRTPSAPPVPDIALPGAETDASAGDAQTAAGDAGPAVALDDLRPPIAVNLLEFVPEVLDGVKARRRQAVKSAPIVHGFYQGEKRKIYNLHITGPNESESARRGNYPLLGKDEKRTDGEIEIQGFKLGEFEGQQTYNSKKKKSEAVVLANRVVEVKLSVAPTDEADEATKLLETLDLQGISKLR